MENYVEVIRTIQENPGDEEAVSALVRDYWDYGIRVARSVLLSADICDIDVAQDMLQSSWIKVLKNINSLTSPEGFAAWYSRIITNTCIDYTRKASVQKEENMPQVWHDDEDESTDLEVIDDTIETQPELAYDQKARKEILDEVLGQLSPEQREIIVMRYYSNMSMKDIAEQLGLPMSTVEGRSRVAQAKIRDSVTEIQKRDDIKLYNLTPLPFFIWLLRDNEENVKIPHNFVPEIMDEAGVAKAAAGTAASTAADRAAGAAVNSAAGSNAMAAAAAGAKAIGVSGFVKVLVGISIATAAFGAVHAVKSQTSDRTGFEDTSTEIADNESNAEDDQNTEDPVIEETPEPVKDVIWEVEPQFAFTTVKEITPNIIQINWSGVELSGYPADWEYNATEQRFGTNTDNAIEVQCGNKSGIYDYSGNELYPITLKCSVLQNDKSVKTETNQAVVYWYYNFVPQSDTSKMFTDDFTATVENDVPVFGLVPGPYWWVIRDGKAAVYNGLESSFNNVPDDQYSQPFTTYKVDNVRNGYFITDEYEGNKKIGKAIVDNNCNYIAHVQSDSDEAKIVNKMIIVSKGSKYGFQSVTGSLITDYIYEDVKIFMDGYAPVRKNGKWGFIDENGKEVTDFIFDDASMVYHGKTYVSIDGVYGILNLAETLESGIEVNGETCKADPERVQEAASAKEDMMIPIGKATVNVYNLNVRKKPSAKADLAASKRSIETGTVFDVYSIKEAEGYTWYQIDDNMWIASNGKWVTYKANKE